MNLIQRVELTQATIDQFLNQPFEWRTRDCAALAHFHLARAGVETCFDKAGNYSTEIGALKALKKLGYSSIEGMADAHLEPISPAYAIVGDVLGFPSKTKKGDEWTALGIHIGDSKALAFEDADGHTLCLWGDATLATKAWRLA